MDVRDSRNPVLVSARRWLARVNARHPWNHNEHFHDWILCNLPARRQVAVDVGCGTGVLAGKLAPHFARVTGIDADEGMAATASAHLERYVTKDRELDGIACSAQLDACDRGD